MHLGGSRVDKKVSVGLLSGVRVGVGASKPTPRFNSGFTFLPQIDTKISAICSINTLIVWRAWSRALGTAVSSIGKRQASCLFRPCVAENRAFRSPKAALGSEQLSPLRTLGPGKAESLGE
uniref:Calmodulin n=1 Tax=Chlorella sp. NTMP01 TaxID=931102 RepID=E5KVD9_9CHLO|nr:calmodulin [Chlorella sp. NTMP01]